MGNSGTIPAYLTEKKSAPRDENFWDESFWFTEAIGDRKAQKRK